MNREGSKCQHPLFDNIIVNQHVEIVQEDVLYLFVRKKIQVK